MNRLDEILNIDENEFSNIVEEILSMGVAIEKENQERGEEGVEAQILVERLKYHWTNYTKQEDIFTKTLILGVFMEKMLEKGEFEE